MAVLLNILIVIALGYGFTEGKESSPSNGTSDCRSCEEKAELFKLKAVVESLVKEQCETKKILDETKSELAATKELLKGKCDAPCNSKPQTSWRLKRIDLTLPKLQKIRLHQTTPTYVERINTLPKNTKAIIVSLFCNFWNGNGHAYLGGDIQQKGNTDGGVAKFFHQHYRVYANTWSEEILVPWDASVSKELEFKITSSYNTGGVNNWFRFKIVGYITV